jgi:hypothetical protein
MNPTRYGRLLVLKEIERKAYVMKDGRISKCRQMRCVCDCGTTKDVVLSNLTSGRQKSCGCLHDEVAGDSTRTHGMSKTVEYAIWAAMKRRCYNPNSVDFVWYGARGIAVCDAWKNSFKAFYDDMGPRPDDMSIDRIDTNKDYSPENCRWVSMKAQANNKRNSRQVQHEGRTQTVQQWSDELGIPYTTTHRFLVMRGKTVAELIASR